MAGHSDSDKKSGDKWNEVSIFNAENMQSNTKVIYYSRTFLSIIGGVIAGILGFTGLAGFIFYLVVMAVTSVGLTAKAKFSIHSYFDSWNRVLLDGFLGGLMSFVLFWTYPFHCFGFDFLFLFVGEKRFVSCSSFFNPLSHVQHWVTAEPRIHLCFLCTLF